MSRLVHYCCDHSAEAIQQDGFVKPNAQPILGGLELSWWTDLVPPVRGALGLTSHILSCDRLEYSFAVLPDDRHLVRPWIQWLRDAPSRLRAAAAVGLHVEETLPVHWWVAEQPIRIQS